jgi:hypothetical protein
MVSIPARLFMHTAIVEPYEGTGPVGAIYGPAVTVRCYATSRPLLVRTATGDAQITQTVLYLPAGTVVPVGSRVTVNGRTATVERVDEQDAGPTGPNHLRVALM